MIGGSLLVLALVLAPDPRGFGDGLQRAIEAMRNRDVQSAWAAAESETDAEKRSQARVYVRLGAGDLDGALADAVHGSKEHPEAAWLAERSVAIALSLNRVRVVDLALARLERAVDLSVEPDRTRWMEMLRAARVEADVLHERTRARDAADVRARWVTGVIGAVCVVALGMMGASERQRATRERERAI